MTSSTPTRTDLFVEFVGGEITLECPTPTGTIGGIITSAYYNGAVVHLMFTHNGHPSGVAGVVPVDIDVSQPSLTLFTTATRNADSCKIVMNRPD